MATLMLNFFFLPDGHVPQESCEVSMLSPLQAVPPFVSCVDMVRTLFFVPVPHVTLQVDHDDQLPHAQLTDIIKRNILF